MRLNELLEILGIDEPDEFEYFENFADLVESDEDIPEETLAELFNHTDPETVSEIIEQYFDDIMTPLTEGHSDIYALLDTIKHVLVALMLEDDDDSSVARFCEELHKFHVWYSFESAVECSDITGEDSKVLPLRDAITVMRMEKLENEERTYDFSDALDYEIDDYVLDLAGESRDRRMEDVSEDFMDNGYVYDDEMKME